MTKQITLTDTQNVILTIASQRKGYIPDHATSTSTADGRSYAAAVNGLIKRGIVEQSGRATEGDFSKDGWRFMVSKAFLEDYFGEEQSGDETPEGDDDSEEVKARRSIVAEVYRAKYKELQAQGGSGQDNNDDFAQWMRGQFVRNVIRNGKETVGLDVGALFSFATENGIEIKKSWEVLNNGQCRMVVGNAIRRLIKAGQRITLNGKTIIKGEPRATEGKPSRKTKKAA